MELSSTDLGAILTEASSIMRFRLRAADAEMHVILPEEPIWILADAGQVKQVLINLMINGVDAMEHAVRKVLEVRVETQGAYASISVSDTGQGISPDKINRIFDPFYTTKPVDRGTGLGLSVCLAIVRQHHGEISVKSVPGEGTLFRTLLPLAKANGPQDPSLDFAQALRPERASRLEPTLGLPRMNVLVIDDEEYITSLVQEVLRSRLGWRTERVHDGRQAIQRLDSTQFDLVITDLRMPGMDGFAILGWIKEFRPALLPRVLVITGDSGGATLDQQLLDLGVPAIRKPFTPDDLIDQCLITLAAC
jgi:CheY-like chemotaxis protein